MHRREFLEQAAKTFLLAAATPLLIRCGSSTPAAAVAGTTYTSTTDSNGHQHTFLVPTTAVQSPASGYSGNTSSAYDGHYHTVTLTSTDLSSIAAGTTVSKTTSTANSHSHTFSL